MFAECANRVARCVFWGATPRPRGPERCALGRFAPRGSLQSLLATTKLANHVAPWPGSAGVALSLGWWARSVDFALFNPCWVCQVGVVYLDCGFGGWVAGSYVQLLARYVAVV